MDYTQGTMLLGNRETQSDAETDRIKTALLPLYLNLSLTELRLDSPHKALKYGNKALEIDAANTKALFRCGQVRQGRFRCLLSKPSDRNPHRRLKVFQVLDIKCLEVTKIGMMTADAIYVQYGESE